MVKSLLFKEKCMRIAQVAPMFEAVPPTHYGGTERVVSYLTEELVRRGHEVTLFASGESRTRARLVPTTERSLRQRFTLEEMKTVSIPLHLAMLGEVFAHAHEFDVMHCHFDYWPFPFAQLVHAPIVTTLHGRLDLSCLPPILQKFPKTPLVSISRSQRRPLKSLHPNWVGNVYNAVPVAEFPFRSKPGDYLLFVGRIAPEKRLDWAIEIAKRTDIPLKIAAKVDPFDQEYFDREIKHLLDDPLVEFIGEVDEQRKRELMAGAYALAFPIDWPEPFGIVQIEALACGTPVLAMNRGSVPEVLRHDITAWVGESVDELVAAVPRIKELDRRACRKDAEERFSVAAMADGYEQVYRRVVMRHRRETLRIALSGQEQHVPAAA